MVIFCVGQLKNAQRVASLRFLASDQIRKITKFTFFFCKIFIKFAKMGFTYNGNTAG